MNTMTSLDCVVRNRLFIADTSTAEQRLHLQLWHWLLC